MARWLAAHWQTALVVLLFTASLAALLVNNFAAFGRADELEARAVLRAAASELAETARAPVADLPPWRDGALPEPANRLLAAVTDKVLRSYPGVEGGAYLNGGTAEQFVGFAHPHGPAPEMNRPLRRDPPPLEASLIRAQAVEALKRAPDEAPVVEVREVGPSRVAVAAAAVGEERPARAAVWVMVRLVSPEQQIERLHRSQASAVLGLGGIVFSLLLLANLGRKLRRSRLHEEQLRDGLRRAEHLAGLGKLLAGVAHEVRNPLAGLRSTVQLWQRLPEQTRPPESLEAILHAVDRLDALVGRLLLFARAGHEDWAPTDLHALVAETYELLRARAAEQGVALQAFLAPDLPPVHGAGQALRQVLLNLATNALQAMPGGGALTCRTRALPGWVELTVSDTGPGVAPQDRAHLFEPFHTTRPDGTGLGLALCREIVEQHGGKIELVSGGRRGATFRVRLPAGPRPAGGRNNVPTKQV